MECEREGAQLRHRFAGEHIDKVLQRARARAQMQAHNGAPVRGEWRNIGRMHGSRKRIARGRVAAYQVAREDGAAHDDSVPMLAYERDVALRGARGRVLRLFHPEFIEMEIVRGGDGERETPREEFDRETRDRACEWRGYQGPS